MNVFRINFWLVFALLAVLTIDSIAASEPEIKATPQRRQFSPGDGYYTPNAAPQRRQFPPGDGHNKPNTAPQQFPPGDGYYKPNAAQQRRQFPPGDKYYVDVRYRVLHRPYETYPAPHQRQLSASNGYYESNTAPRSSEYYPAQRQWHPTVTGGKSTYQQPSSQYE